MNCEVCGGTAVTARLETPAGSYYLDWGCEQLAETLIRNGTRPARWSLVGWSGPPAAAEAPLPKLTAAEVLGAMLDRSAS